jgi:hypothetical protein
MRSDTLCQLASSAVQTGRPASPRDAADAPQMSRRASRSRGRGRNRGRNRPSRFSMPTGMSARRCGLRFGLPGRSPGGGGRAAARPDPQHASGAVVAGGSPTRRSGQNWQGARQDSGRCRKRTGSRPGVPGTLDTTVGAPGRESTSEPLHAGNLWNPCNLWPAGSVDRLNWPHSSQPRPRISGSLRTRGIGASAGP